MEMRVFNLPTINDDVYIIERQWCELNTKLRNGSVLDEVELNWYDTANTWLLSVQSKMQ